MIPKIDQSGKIEQTNKDTILCISNDGWDAVTIKANIKRQTQEIFRRHGQTRNFVLFTFSAGLAILIKRNLKNTHIIIDREYYGKEPVIKEIVLEILQRSKKIPEIRFEFIGKKPLAHHRAYAIGLGKLKTKKSVTLEELWTELKKTEVVKRLKNA